MRTVVIKRKQPALALLTVLALGLWAGREISGADTGAAAAPGLNPPVTAATSAPAQLKTGPTEIGSRKQLFVDDRWIARCQGVTLTMHEPVKMNQPVLASDVPWEGEAGASVAAYSSVIKEGGWIRIWGSGKAMLPVRLTPDGPVIALLAYAESSDGIHFTKPDRSLVAYDETRAELGQHGRIGGVSVWIDPKAPPSQRYKSQAKFQR